MHTSKLNIAIATMMVTEILEDPGMTHSKAIEHDFRELKEARDISFIFGDEENDLPNFCGYRGSTPAQECGLHAHSRWSTSFLETQETRGRHILDDAGRGRKSGRNRCGNVAAPPIRENLPTTLYQQMIL